MDQQGGSIQVIGTDLAMAFSAGVNQLTNELQKHARQKLQYRIGKLASLDDLTLNTLDAEGKTVIEELIANGGKAVGLSATLAGLTATGLALQTALATPIPWWGVGGTSLTTLFAGALAPWAIPAILVGIGLYWGSNKYRETRRRQQREAFIASARTGLDRDCSTLEQHLGAQLNDYITSAWQQAEERVARQREALDGLIAETDLSTLETRITATRDEERRLTDIARRLDDLLGKVV